MPAPINRLPFGSTTTKRRKVPISQLDLDLRNARFRDDAANQTQALEFMLAVAGEKCLGLLKDLCTTGRLNPSDVPIVVNDGSRFRVLEGNRRLTCLKIWRDPSLLDSLTDELKDKYSRRFRAVISASPYSPPKSIDVVIVATVEEADNWIDKKHGLGQEGGASTVEWSSFQKDRRRFRQTGKRSQSYSFVELLNAQYEDDPEMTDLLTRAIGAQYTTLDRLVKNPVMRDDFGIRYLSGGRTRMDRSAEQMRPLLYEVLYDLAEKNVDSRSLHSSDDTSKYLQELIAAHPLEKDFSPDPGAEGGPGAEGEPVDASADVVEKEESKPKQDLSTPLPTPNAQPKNRGSKSSQRVFQGITLSGFSKKTANLADNTSRLSVSANPNVVAILLRVLLDLTCQQFLTEFSKKDIPRDLDKRILATLKILDPQASDDLKQAENARYTNTLFHLVKNDSNNLKLLQFVLHSSTHSATVQETMELARRFEPMLDEMNRMMLEGETP